MSYQQSSGAENNTTHGVFKTNQPITFIWLLLLQRSCNEMKMLSWPILQQ